MSTISGVTKNEVGTTLGSCDVFLFKYDSGTKVLTQVGYMVSDISTGAYSFTLADTDPSYIAVFFKDGPQNVFDVTDHNIQPV